MSFKKKFLFSSAAIWSHYHSEATLNSIFYVGFFWEVHRSSVNSDPSPCDWKLMGRESQRETFLFVIIVAPPKAIGQDKYILKATLYELSFLRSSTERVPSEDLGGLQVFDRTSYPAWTPSFVSCHGTCGSIQLRLMRKLPPRLTCF